jgi:nucleotide-binding universal stress UspA family protein
MLKNILVPLDGSDLSQQILERLEPIFLQEHPEVRFLRAVEDESQVAAAEAELEAFAETLAPRRANFTLQVEVGEPAGVILSCVDATTPDLVAMSTHGASGLSRWARGSVAERVLRSCPVPLLLANPAGLEESGRLGFKRILVPLDGSKAAAEILPFVEQLARANGAEVLLLCADRPEVMVAPMGSPTQPDQGQRAREILAPYANMLTTAGVAVQARVAIGPAAEWILKIAEEESVDLLAMTTHGRSGPSRWLFGSVAEKVLRASPCPLAIRRSTV